MTSQIPELCRRFSWLRKASVLPVSKAETQSPAWLQVIWNSKMREEVLAQLETYEQDPQASAASAQVGP